MAISFTAVLALGNTCGGAPAPITAALAGDYEYQSIGRLDLFGILVQVAGGNAMVTRSDWDTDTRLGPFSLDATYNSASGAWHWAHDSTYDGTTFAAPSGAAFDVSAVPAGSAIPGTHWVVVSSTAIQTKGGMLFEFAPSGNIATVRWQSASLPRIDYSEAVIAGELRVIGASQCLTATTCVDLFSVVHDAATGEIDSVADATGRTASYTYDSAGRLETARDPLDLVKDWAGWRYEYDGGHLVALTNSEGERIEIAYDAAFPGRTRAVRRVDGSGTAFRQYTLEYSTGLLHNATRVTDPTFVFDWAWTYDWDDQYRLLAKHSPAGDTTSWEWGSASGLRPTRVTEPNGASLQLTYDGDSDDPTGIVQPSGNSLVIVYEPNGENRFDRNKTPVSSLADSLGLITQQTFDAQGRLASVTNGAAETTTVYYSSVNMLGTAVDPDSTTTNYAYGLSRHGHAIAVSRDVGNFSTTYSYDALGNLLRGSDLSSPIATGMPGFQGRSFDADRNLETIVLRSTETTTSGSDWTTGTLTITWRSDHQIGSITRPNGDDVEFERNGFGQVITRRERVDGAWAATTFSYSLLGTLAATELPNGMRREYTYHPDGNISGRLFLRDGMIESQASETYANGRLANVLDTSYSAASSYTYDSAGRVQRIDYPDGEYVLYEYDLRSRPTKESFYFDTGLPMHEVTYTYDLANRRNETRIDGKLLTRNSYVDGLLTAEEFGNGLRRTYEHVDDDIEISELLDSSGASVALAATWRELCSVYPVWSNCAVAASDSASLAPSGRFEEHLMAPFSPTGLTGQRVSHTSSGDKYRWYSYDQAGNITQHIDLSSSFQFNYAPVDYEYNSEHNRLLEVIDTGDSTTLHSYAYDSAGFVALRDGEAFVFQANGRIQSIGTRMNFVWDSHGRLVERTIDGVRLALRFGGRSTADASGTPRTLSVGNIVVEAVSGRERYRHEDYRGNVLWLSDENGTIVTHYIYSAYSREEVLGDASDRVRFANGSELDDELVIVGARVYDQSVGRFLSPDPSYQVVNQFAYTTGNPIQLTDSTGLQMRSILSHTASAGTIRQVSFIGALIGFIAVTGGASLVIVGGGSFTAQVTVAGLGVLAAALGLWVATVEPVPGCDGCNVRITDIDPPGPVASVTPLSQVGVGAPGCAPVQSNAAPDPVGLLAFLLELQVLLAGGLFVLRRIEQ